ncbi:MAG: hypothetical protein H0U57_07340 [Tatlockia sp.]|nr:hypothetical protein [Tatlockia sp.]
MRIIFLDIDDLMLVNDYINPSITELNTLRQELKIKHTVQTVDSLKDKSLIGFLNFTPLAVDYLKMLCQEDDVKIVISSTWRYKHSQNQFNALFGIYDLNDRVIGSTPDIDIFNRAQEIESWLRSQITEVDAYIILDDLDEGISVPFLTRFVHCPKGFHFAQHYEEAYQKLNTPLRGEKSNTWQFVESIKHSISSQQAILLRPFDIFEYTLINQCNRSVFIKVLWDIIQSYPPDTACSFIFDNLSSDIILELLSFLHERKVKFNNLHFLDCRNDLATVIRDWIIQFTYSLHLKITWRKCNFNNALLESIVNNKNLSLEFHYSEFVFWQIEHRLISQLEREKRIDWYCYDPGYEKPVSFKISVSKNGPQFFKLPSYQNQINLNLLNQTNEDNHYYSSDIVVTI